MREKEYLDMLDEEAKKLYKSAVKKLKYKETEGLEQDFLEIIKTYTNFVPAYNKLGVLYIYINDKKKAEEYFNEAVALDREFAPSLSNLGSLAKEAGHIEEAKQYYERAIAADEEYGVAYNNLAVIYREEGNYHQSVKYIKKAKKYNHNIFDADVDKPLYKEPGCIFIFLLILAIIITFYLLM
ncbi:tetratricopeptide repeat protein [Natronospora cellulosivora (SeqCode)]